MDDLIERLRTVARSDTAMSEFAPDEHISWIAADRIKELEQADANAKADIEALHSSVNALEAQLEQQKPHKPWCRSIDPDGQRLGWKCSCGLQAIINDTPQDEES